MFKKLFITLIAVSFFVSNSEAQYLISDFEADSLNTWQVFMNGSLNSNLRNSNYSYATDSKSLNNNFDPNISFHQRVLDRNVIWKTDASASLTTNRSAITQKYSESDDKNRQLSIYGSTDYTNYFDYDMAWNIGARLSSAISSNVNYRESITSKVSKNINDDKSTYRTFDVAITPGFVKGREYDAQFGAKAMEIINELRKEGVLKREITKKEFLQLSQIIMTRQASYHYDSRTKRMEALNDIIGYLKKIDVIDCETVKPTVIVDDIYSYDLNNIRVPRKSGIEFRLNTILEYSNSRQFDNDINEDFNYADKKYFIYFRDINEYTYRDKISYLGLQFQAKFNEIIDWNQYYNYGVMVASRFGKLNEDNDYINKDLYWSPAASKVVNKSDYKQDSKLSNSNLNIYFNYYYQFTSRSIAKVNFSTSYQKEKQELEKSKWEDSIEIYRFSITPQYTYYFTPKLYLEGSCGYSFNKYWNISSYSSAIKQFQNYYSFSIGVGYYL